MDAAFIPVPACWICGGRHFKPYHRLVFELSAFRDQHPGLNLYSGKSLWLQRCRACGFAQPEAMPSLPNYYDLLYDQLWGEEWMHTEFDSGYKDLIFNTTLKDLERRVTGEPRSILDIGAHVGRFIHLAAGRGWKAEGIELNPRTCAFAAQRTGLTVHRLNAHQLAAEGRSYDAVTLIDVLEHIPEPVAIMANAYGLLKPGGWFAIKVPHGRTQWIKEIIHEKLSRNYHATLADNLVHVNHFSGGSLRRALLAVGFDKVHLAVGAPECPPLTPADGFLKRVALAGRKATYDLMAALPGEIAVPFGLHLQAYAHKPA